MSFYEKAIQEFPEDNSLKTFNAMTLYNLGHSSNSVKELLSLLIETTSDEQILKYKRALDFYHDKLDQTWN